MAWLYRVWRRPVGGEVCRKTPPCCIWTGRTSITEPSLRLSTLVCTLAQGSDNPSGRQTARLTERRRENRSDIVTWQPAGQLESQVKTDMMLTVVFLLTPHYR